MARAEEMRKEGLDSMDTMTKFERIETIVNLKEADRVPVDPLNIYIHAYQGGITLREFIYDQ